jgi:hypothetical protein
LNRPLELTQIPSTRRLRAHCSSRIILRPARLLVVLERRLSLENRRRMHNRLLVIAVLLALLPATSQAYVDPGLISAMYQLAYMAVAALAAAFIFRPWEYLKGRFRSLFGKDDAHSAGPQEDAAPESEARRQESDEQD